MTIPALMTSYQKKITSIRLKKVYAELTQLIKLSEAENGIMQYWDFSSESSLADNRKFINRYILPYSKHLSECSQRIDYKCGMPISNAGITYISSGGYSLSMLSYSSSKRILVMVTINPSTNMKQSDLSIGRNAFYFQMRDGKFLPTGWQDGLTRDQIKSGWTTDDAYRSYFSCKSTQNNSRDYNKHGCTALLFFDKFEFKDDYPW